MKPFRRSFLVTIAFLLIPSFAVAQTSRSVTAAANKSWSKFFAEFRVAVTTRDRAALKKMTSASFDWTGDRLGETPDDVIGDLDNDEARQKGQPRMWILLQRSLTFSRFKATTYGSRPARSNYSRNAAYCFFVFETDGRWRWQSFLGD